MNTGRKRAIVYVDGYNWYHAIFKHNPHLKWLNIQHFFEALRPHEEIQSVKLFTAIVDEEAHASDARERQLRYLQALGTLSKLKIIKGKFQDREVTCRADCKQKYKVPEEKKTDVHIAVEILSDAFQRGCDLMIVVSGDSDVQPPVEWVKANCKDIEVLVYIPVLPAERNSRRLDYYSRINVPCKFLPTENLKDFQFPNLVKISEGKFAVRPHSWA